MSLIVEEMKDGASHAQCPEPLYPVEVISDVRRDGLPQYYWRADDPTSPPNNYAGFGLTNGYSTYSCARGDWIHAVGTSPGIGVLYESQISPSGFEYQTFRLTPIGESNTPRIYDDEAHALIDGKYGTNQWLARHDLALSKDIAKIDLGMPVEIDHHSNCDNVGWYQPYWTDSRNKLWVYDWQQNKPLGPIDIRFAQYEISPLGNWLRGGKSGLNRFYELPMLIDSAECPSTTQDHSGWSFDIHGREVFVSKDSSRDMYYLFIPDIDYSVRVDLFSHKLLDWTNHHVASITNPALKGWTLLSTYSQNTRWSDNQLLLVELVPNGRVIRLGNHGVQWWQGTKERSYFCEAWASVDYEGRYIYWGSNDRGTRNLELVRMRIPDEALELMGWKAAPVEPPLPEPIWSPVPLLCRVINGNIEWKLQ